MNGADEHVEEAEEFVEDVAVMEPNSLLTKLDLSDVDIYSMYGQNNEAMPETPGSELGEDELYKETGGE